MSYTHLKKNKKAQLLKALRTPLTEGGYLQCQGQLTREIDYAGQRADSFCCLGVATNIMVLDGKLRWDDDAIDVGGLGDSELTYNEESMPGKQVLRYFGMDIELSEKLAEMNDNDMSFLTIAYWIEENV